MAMLLPPDLLSEMEMDGLLEEVDAGKQFWKEYREVSVQKDSLRDLLDRFYTEESQLTIAIHGKRIFSTARGIQGIYDLFTIMPEVGFVEFYDDKSCRSIQSWEGGHIVTVPGFSSNRSYLRMLFIAWHTVASQRKMFIVNDMFHVFEAGSCLTVGGLTERVTEVSSDVASEESGIPTSDAPASVRDLSTAVADLNLGILNSEPTGQVGPSEQYTGVEPCGFEKWIYVGNLPPNITIRELVQLFTQFGRVNEPSISPMRKADGFCYSFVEFDSPIAVSQAIKAFPLSFKGRQVYVRGRTFSKDKQIYVGNLFPGATTTDVENILKEFGSIRTANTSIHTQDDGFTFAITELDTVAAVEKAIEASFLRIGNRNISIRRTSSGAPSRAQQGGN